MSTQDDRRAMGLKKAIEGFLKNSSKTYTVETLIKRFGMPQKYAYLAEQVLKEQQHKKKKIETPAPSLYKKRYEQDENAHRLGIFIQTKHGGELRPAHRKDTAHALQINKKQSEGLKDGDVILYQIEKKEVHIRQVIGAFADPRVYSLMTIFNANMPFDFSKEAQEDAEKGAIPDLKNRVDLRDIPFVTIDGEDARDFDDAVFAKADIRPENPKGWLLWVAIADVSYYVHPGTALDHEAYLRGNSVYFPDRVVPMLPEYLSNGLCSLRPNEDRACLAVEMIINAQGILQSCHFVRGLMKSRARLTYTQVQYAIEGKSDEACTPIYDDILKPLYQAYLCLKKARKQRGTIDFDVPEYQVHFDKNHVLRDITKRTHLEAHQLIEECMIAANISAAKALLAKGVPTLYRTHESPEDLRYSDLCLVLQAQNVPFKKVKKVTPAHFQEILDLVKEHPARIMIHQLILRCQSQARYTPDAETGHFGLSLDHYSHFTSPIRRYSDLIIHRTLIEALSLGHDGRIPESKEKLRETGQHLCTRERAAVSAEREVKERYAAAFLYKRVGEKFSGVITGFSKSGMFVTIDSVGAEGFIPLHSVTFDHLILDAQQYRYIGKRTKIVYQMGQEVSVVLKESNPMTSNIIFTLMRPSGDAPKANQKVIHKKHEDTHEHKRPKRHIKRKPRKDHKVDA